MIRNCNATEKHLYISSRRYQHPTHGLRNLERTNQLGNVLSLISDRKYPAEGSTAGEVGYFNPDIGSANDYYSFGWLMPGRNWKDGNFA